jgi:hypothetical protein
MPDGELIPPITAEMILEGMTGENTREKLFFPELRLGSGYTGIAERRVDLLTVETAPGKGYAATAYEIKVSRSDFLREAKEPRKQRGARLFCDFFYYVTPPGLLKVDEVPDWAGLIEWSPEGRKVIVSAPRLDKMPPTWGLLISVARNVSGWSASQTLAQKLDDLKRENSALQRQLGYAEWELKRLKEKASPKRTGGSDE